MRTFVFFFLVTLWAPSAWAQAPNCDDARHLLSSLPQTAHELAGQLTTGQVRATSCVVGHGLRCENVTGEGWSAALFEITPEKLTFSELNAVVLSAKAGTLQDQTWLVEQVRGQDWRAEHLTMDSDCEWKGLRVGNLSADTASQETMEGVTVNGLPTFIRRWDEPSPGLLPPTLRYAEAWEASLNGFVLGWLGLGVNVSTEWLGGHAVVGSDEARVVEVGVVSPEGEGVRAHLVGAVRVSDRASGTFEVSDDGLLAGRRLEAGAFPRQAQRSRTGLSLRGVEHALQAGWTGTHANGETHDRAVLTLASHEQVGRLTLDTDLSHTSWIDSGLGDDTSAHGSQVGFRLGALLGRSGLEIQPGVDAGMTFGMIPSSEGFEASTTASVIPNVRARFVLLGRFERLEHRVVLQALAGAEVYGFTQREPLPPRLPAYLYGREAESMFGAAQMTNELEAAAWRLSVPVGVQARAGRELVAWTGAHARLHGWETNVEVVCEKSCDEPALRGDTALRFDHLDVLVGATRGAAVGTDFSGPARFADGPGLAATIPFDATLGWAALAQWNLRFMPFESELRAFEAEEARGGDLRIHWNSGLGWRLSLAGGMDVARDVKAAMVGVSFIP